MNSEGIFDHYEIRLPHDTVFNIYVTAEYKRHFGAGFGYGEIPDIVRWLEDFLDYQLKNVVLNAFFVHGESFVEPVHISAATGHGIDPKQQEMIINGKAMNRYDFRTTIVHEFIHVYHMQWFREHGNLGQLNTLDGNTMSFWYIEGLAEYMSYRYDLPQNVHNSLPLIPRRTREEILEMAEGLAWGAPIVQPGIKDIYSFYLVGHESNHNYGVIYSLTWYLVNMYGIDTFNNYALALSNALEFRGKTYAQMSRQHRERITSHFFGKTERQLMDEWLAFFNSFECDQVLPTAGKWRLQEPLYFMMGVFLPWQEMKDLLTGKWLGYLGGTIEHTISGLDTVVANESCHTVLFLNPSTASLEALERWPARAAHLLPLTPGEIRQVVGSTPFIYLERDAQGRVRGIIAAHTDKQFMDGIRRLLLADGIPLNEIVRYDSTEQPGLAFTTLSPTGLFARTAPYKAVLTATGSNFGNVTKILLQEPICESTRTLPISRPLHYMGAAQGDLVSAGSLSPLILPSDDLFWA